MQDVKCKKLSFSTHNSQVDMEKKERREKKKIESRRSKTRTTALSCSLSKPKSLSFRRATTCSFTENGVDKVAKVKRHLMSKGQKQTTWTVIGNICVRLLAFFESSLRVTWNMLLNWKLMFQWASIAFCCPISSLSHAQLWKIFHIFSSSYLTMANLRSRFLLFISGALLSCLTALCLIQSLHNKCIELFRAAIESWICLLSTQHSLVLCQWEIAVISSLTFFNYARKYIIHNLAWKSLSLGTAINHTSPQVVVIL